MAKREKYVHTEPDRFGDPGVMILWLLAFGAGFYGLLGLIAWALGWLPWQ